MLFNVYVTRKTERTRGWVTLKGGKRDKEYGIGNQPARSLFEESRCANVNMK